MSFFAIAIKPPPIDWSPVATLAFFACAGSYVGTITTIPIEAVFFTLALVVPMSIAGLVIRNKFRFVILIAATLLLFFGRSSVASTRDDPLWAVSGNGDLMSLRLRVTSSPATSPKTVGEMARFDHQETSTLFTASAVPCNTKAKSVSIDVVCSERVFVRIGDRAKATGWLQIPKNENNSIVFYVTKNSSIQITNKTKSTKSFKDDVRWNLLLGLEQAQTTLARALFFGVRDSGWKKISKTFQQAGMSHILAISGMHIAILLLFISTILQKLPIQRTTSILLVLLATWVLANVIDLRTPVIRAMNMVVIYMLFKLIGFRSQPVSLLAISALSMLLLKPRDAGTAGFQLSYAVVGTIVILMPQMKWHLLGPADVNAPSSKMASRWLSSMWITGTCAWLVATPISARLFGSISPAGLLSSVPSIALLSVVLCVGTAKTIIGYISTLAVLPITTLFSSALSLLTESARAFGSLPQAHFQGVYISWFLALVLVLSFFTIVVVRKKKKTTLLTLALCTICTIEKPWSTNNQTVITTVNVGHGTCHIVQNNGETLVVDAGSRNNLDIGRDRIVPVLRRLGVATINTLVVTHSDIDHLCGIIDIAREINIQKIIIAKQTIENKTKPLELVLKSAEKKKIKILQRSSGWSEYIGDAKITMLSPKKQEKHRTANAHSIVLLLDTNNRTALFTGDIDEKKITELSRQLPKTIDIMELPHHGQWSVESNKLVHNNYPAVLIQSTNIARHAKDSWVVPPKTQRFVTAIDGTITSIIYESGRIEVLGSRLPATMPQCQFYK